MDRLHGRPALSKIQTQEAVYLYLFTILKLNSVRLETSAFSEFQRCGGV